MTAKNARTFGSLLLLVLVAAPALAQDTTRVPAGVRLATRYTVMKRPFVAVRPPSVTPDLSELSQQVGTILERDLDYSDRFDMGTTPAALASGPVDYAQWNSLNIVFVVASELVPAGGGYRLNVEVHDVPFGRLKERASFQLPAANAPDFRLAVHSAADTVVRMMAGEPGAAASRIVFTRWSRNGTGSELMIVDSDGENLRRLITSREMFYSPAWSPEGNRVAYAVRSGARIELREHNLITGADRAVSNRSVMAYTPAYSPDGKRLAFAFAIQNGSEVQEIDLDRAGSPRRLTQGRFFDAAPSYSSDGQRIAFHSDRLGTPHIFVSGADGSQPTALTPLGARVKFTSPDWSPTGNDIVFSGESQGGFHLMIVQANRPGTAEQITATGSNEDPSWAPDGRHIVYSGVGREGSGLYVIDRLSGRTRKLVSGDGLRMADWSSRLAATGFAAATGN